MYFLVLIVQSSACTAATTLEAKLHSPVYIWFPQKQDEPVGFYVS